jgi:hypothetical protein
MFEPWDPPTETEEPEVTNEEPPNNDDLGNTNEPNPTDAAPVPVTTSRTGRNIRSPIRLIETMACAFFLHSYSPQPIENTALHLLQPDIEAYSEPHPLAFITEQVTAMIGSDPDTMHMNEALMQPDREEFIKAMHKELNDHVKRKHWKIVPLSSVPKDKVTLPMVWSMKRKRNPIGEITKWKARLCAGGHKSVEYVDYWETYSPVVSWNTVRLLIVLSLLNDWHM